MRISRLVAQKHRKAEQTKLEPEYIAWKLINKNFTPSSSIHIEMILDQKGIKRDKAWAEQSSSKPSEITLVFNTDKISPEQAKKVTEDITKRYDPQDF